MPGGFTPPEQIKTEGFPGGREPAGARTHWEGMKNTMALCLLYLDVSNFTFRETTVAPLFLCFALNCDKKPRGHHCPRGFSYPIVRLRA